jgi:hypothetical protein
MRLYALLTVFFLTLILLAGCKEKSVCGDFKCSDSERQDKSCKRDCYRCEFGPEFQCLDFSVSSSEIHLVLKNNLGKNINDVQINIAGDETNRCGSYSLPPILSGETKTVDLTCSQIDLSKLFKSSAVLTFKREGSAYDQTLTGELVGIVNG